LCAYVPEQAGSHELYIPGDGCVYATPDLVVHYMNAHGYLPPLEFCIAVSACPPMHTMEYLKAIKAAGGAGLARHGAEQGHEADER
jgi:hypothetical protein